MSHTANTGIVLLCGLFGMLVVVLLSSVYVMIARRREISQVPQHR